jgi:hypothetical protein
MKRPRLLILAIAVLALGQVHAAQLSQTQQAELTNIGMEHMKAGAKLEAEVDAKLMELQVELTREGRLASKEAAATSAKQANVIMKDIGKLAGQVVKAQVEFLLKAKNVLTVEQKLHLLEQLAQAAVPELEKLEFLETEIVHLPLELDMEQRKKLINLEAVMTSDEVRAERDA